jgi:superfamily II RNA helicase
LQASGANWEQIMADTTLDEGDVVRMLRRTADFLAQIKLVNTLPEGLVAKAAKAAKLVNRAPIADLAMF